ncbi:unnamed protein product, partial [Iphiclides podalirius]
MSDPAIGAGAASAAGPGLRSITTVIDPRSLSDEIALFSINASNRPQPPARRPPKRPTRNNIISRDSERGAAQHLTLKTVTERIDRRGGQESLGAGKNQCDPAVVTPPNTLKCRLLLQVGSTMDISKYSIEEKYRYGMYTDPSRGYLDSAALSKAYMYMDQQQQRPYPVDISKMYSEASAAMAGLGSVNSSSSLSPRSPAESPDVAAKSQAESSSGSNPSPSLPYYQTPSSLLMPQYPGQYAQAAQGGPEFRRPLTVIF